MVSITLAALTFPRCYSWYPLQAGSTWKCRSIYFVQFRPAAYGSHQPVVTSCNVGNRVSQLGYLLASVCWNLSKTFSPPMVFATVKFWMQKLIQTQWEMSASLFAFHKSNRSNTYIKNLHLTWWTFSITELSSPSQWFNSEVSRQWIYWWLYNSSCLDSNGKLLNAIIVS